MNILVVGGSGLIGGHAALHLASLGHAVTIAARRPPPTTSALASLPFRACDYLAAEPDLGLLSGFDVLVFAAGNDIRHVPPGGDEEAHWQHANAEGVPRYFALAREAGIKKGVMIGSFYPQAAPQLLSIKPYVRGRLLADEGARAQATSTFEVCSVNAPFVIGTVPGLPVPGLAAHAAYALGHLRQVPEFAIPGGVNFISTRSLSEAIAGAIVRGVSGKAYLVGDENLSFEDYFGALFEAAGRSRPPLRDEPHPLLPDAILYAGRGGRIYYEPDADEQRLLGYRRDDVQPTLAEIVAFYLQPPA